MRPFSTLTLSSLLAAALASCHAADQPPAAVTPPADTSPAAASGGPASPPPIGTDASVTGPLPRPAHAAPPAPASLAGPVDAVPWRCGTRAITTRFDPATDAVQLSVEGRTLTLLSAQAASGARFADAQGNQFWEHAGEATLSLAGGEAVKCVHEAATTIG
ncbi:MULTISPECIES: MliC family protein [Xanthomonas]|uniref:MliC family protein n=1 Tax=Xanthomonas dyei TaxID=743699 RepID=A0ABZ0DBY9_9XANT|nr:MliC family protein [Xanthomonas dyei]WOB25818.1 MliC family protein [Xanthomonas dyei]WOB53441.1 MliC family protein [Xanthomonas dyei]